MYLLVCIVHDSRGLKPRGCRLSFTRMRNAYQPASAKIRQTTRVKTRAAHVFIGLGCARQPRAEAARLSFIIWITWIGAGQPWTEAERLWLIICVMWIGAGQSWTEASRLSFIIWIIWIGAGQPWTEASRLWLIIWVMWIGVGQPWTEASRLSFIIYAYVQSRIKSRGSFGFGAAAE